MTPTNDRGAAALADWMRYDRAALEAELARLRKIEAAARDVVSGYEAWRCGEIDELWPVIDPLRAALESDQ